jgi:hypothetical protein
MKLFSGIITILFALLISATAAWFSVAGLVALFAATAIPVMIMGTVLESSKLVAAGWLHSNWKNPNVNFVHKAYLTIAVIALMIITSIGIYGFLSKGHLEQAAPIAGIELQIAAKQQQIQMLQDSNTRLEEEQKQMDAGVSAFLQGGSLRGAQAGLKARGRQSSERASIQKQMEANNDQIQKLDADILPLKQQTVEVEAKLGPVKYVAQLFGWQDTDKAVRLVILTIMVAFDPLAVILLISATISFGEWAEEKRAKKAEQTKQSISPANNTRLPTGYKIVDVNTPVVADDVSNTDMRVVSPSMAYAPGFTGNENGVPVRTENTSAITDSDVGRYRKSQDQLIDPVEPISNSNIVTVIEPGFVLSEVTSTVPEVNEQPEVSDAAEVAYTSEETIAPIRSDLEDIHGRGEPTFGIATEVVDANEPSFQQEETTQDNEDKLAGLRATDILAPEAAASVEIVLETAPEAHQELSVDVATPVADAAPNDKERLIEILEKRPEFLQDLIDVISSHRQQEEANTTKAKTTAPVKTGPKPWIS